MKKVRPRLLNYFEMINQLIPNKMKFFNVLTCHLFRPIYSHKNLEGNMDFAFK